MKEESPWIYPGECQAETEESIRAELAKEFPGIQFSIEKFSPESRIGDTAISLIWLDGPTFVAVHAITYKFYSEKGCYVILRRNFSWHFIESVVSQFCAVLKIPCIGVFGTKNDAWAYTNALKDSERYHLYDIVDKTDAKNQHRVYEALKDAEAAEERERDERESMKKAQAEREEQERAEAEAKRERVRQEQQERVRFAYRPTPTGRERALADLGLPSTATRADVVRAFRRNVKAASDGKGGYKSDMDLLVNAKECALG